MTRNIEADFRTAIRVAAAGNDHCFLVMYAGEPRAWLRHPAASDHQLDHLRVFTDTYARAAGVTVRTARTRLRALCAAGLMREIPTTGGCTVWTFTDASVRTAIGAVIIARLAASGYRFIDQRDA